MSEKETNSKITSTVKTDATKPKDPRKVEAGKRLAAISKEAKKKKADATSAMETANTNVNTATDLKEVGLMVSVVGILVGVAGLYYKFGKKSECVNGSPEDNEVSGASEAHGRKTTSTEQHPQHPPGLFYVKIFYVVINE